jgi:hypothetical protein
MPWATAFAAPHLARCPSGMFAGVPSYIELTLIQEVTYMKKFKNKGHGYTVCRCFVGQRSASDVVAALLAVHQS